MDLDKTIKGIPIDLYAIELVSGDISIKGKGSISLDEDGLIELKLFADESKNYTIYSVFDSFKETQEKVGKILTEDSYFSITGIAPNNDKYQCSRIYIKECDNLKVFTAIICSDLIISNSLTSDSFKTAKIEIPYKLRIPENNVIQSEKKYSDKWVSRSASLDIFEVILQNQSIIIFTDSQSTNILIQNDNYDTLGNDIPKIIDSISFLTSSIIDRYVIEYANNKNGAYKRVFRFFHKQRRKVLRGLPPLYISSSMKRENYTELFLKYYDFLQNRNYESVIETLCRIISAQNSYITSYALTITVAIETILLEYYSDRVKPLTKNEINSAIDEIKQTSICENLKKRVIGMLNGVIGQVRADDIIKALVEEGKIKKEYFENWKKLRNSVNHGKDPSPDFQIYTDLCESNLVFYYTLILLLIDYKGEYTDYSTYGHPLIQLK